MAATDTWALLPVTPVCNMVTTAPPWHTIVAPSGLHADHWPVQFHSSSAMLHARMGNLTDQHISAFYLLNTFLTPAWTTHATTHHLSIVNDAWLGVINIYRISAWLVPRLIDAWVGHPFNHWTLSSHQHHHYHYYLQIVYQPRSRTTNVLTLLTMKLNSSTLFYKPSLRW